MSGLSTALTHREIEDCAHAFFFSQLTADHENDKDLLVLIASQDGYAALHSVRGSLNYQASGWKDV